MMAEFLQILERYAAAQVSGKKAAGIGEAPSWVTAPLLSGGVGSGVVFCYAYLHYMKENTDALRSEEYNIKRLALDRPESTRAKPTRAAAPPMRREEPLLVSRCGTLGARRTRSSGF